MVYSSVINVALLPPLTRPSCPCCCHQNHLLWFNLAALLISLSGLRRWLDPASPDALPGLGWVEGTLRWGSATCVPTMLFANGVWMYGKPIISKRTGAEVRGLCCGSWKSL